MTMTVTVMYPSTPPPYQVIAILELASVEDLQSLITECGDEVMGDISNFTDVTPVIQIGENL